ncbi:MAG: flavodoxin domain-containing protein [Parcubacteria group bacterium]
MKKTAVVYISYLGTSKLYAEWLGEDIGADVLSYTSATPDVLKQYDSIVVLSGTYLGRMPLTSFLKKHWRSLSGKRIVVGAVNVLAPGDPENATIYNRIPDTIRAGISFVKLPGYLGKGGSPAGPITRDNLAPIRALLH